MPDIYICVKSLTKPGKKYGGNAVAAVFRVIGPIFDVEGVPYTRQQNFIQLKAYDLQEMRIFDKF